MNLTGTVVAVNQQSDSVTLIDLKTMEAYRHVPVVGGPHEAAASPDGRTVVVTNYNKQGVGSAEDAERAGAAERRHDQDHRPRRVPRAARRALGGCRRTWWSPRRPIRRCSLVNVTSGAIERVFRTEAGVSHMLALSTDRTRLYCSNMRDGSVSAFDFKTGEKIKDVKTGKECEGVGVTPDGRWVWAGNRAEDTISIIDTRTLEVTKRIPSPGFPYRVQFTPDGKFALMPHAQASSLVVADVATQTIVKSIKLGLTKVARAVDRRRVPASRQPPRVRDGAKRQLDAGARSHDRRDAGPGRGAEQPRRRDVFAGAAVEAFSGCTSSTSFAARMGRSTPATHAIRAPGCARTTAAAARGIPQAGVQ